MAKKAANDIQSITKTMYLNLKLELGAEINYEHYNSKR